ncbi:MAG: hypothetical protein MHM6MM_005762 [Cercozoa sp. M6MM]
MGRKQLDHSKNARARVASKPAQADEPAKKKRKLRRQQRQKQRRQEARVATTQKKGRSNMPKIDSKNTAAKSSHAQVEVPIRQLDGQNLLLHRYRTLLERWPSDVVRLPDPSLPGGESRRAELLDLYDEAAQAGEEFCWAIPSDKALDIISKLGDKVVELGAGSGYWAQLLSHRGLHVDAYDMYTHTEQNDDSGRAAFFHVQKGGPSVLKQAHHRDSVLLLCYPDEDVAEGSTESMARECLRHFSGDTVVVCGEMFGDTLMQNTPFGRTCGGDFQLHLATHYHCVLRMPLPSWPLSRDVMTVWKRSTQALVRAEGDDEQMPFKWVPEDERIELIGAAPKFRHLFGD